MWYVWYWDVAPSMNWGGEFSVEVVAYVAGGDTSAQKVNGRLSTSGVFGEEGVESCWR